MTPDQMWMEFRQKHNLEGKNYEAWSFGMDDQTADQLADLVLKGIKTATASAYPLYEIEGEPLPVVGDYSIILDSKGQAKCLIQTSQVTVKAFIEVDSHHAYKEGEGDRSLDYWRQVHQEFFSKEVSQAGLEFDDQMKVVCEEFEVVYQGEE